MKRADYFITLDKGKIVAINSGAPQHELFENQIEISKDEFSLLYSVSGNIEHAEDMIKSLKERIKEHEEG